MVTALLPSLVLLLSPPQDDGYRDAEIGLTFASPGEAWEEAGAGPAAGGGFQYSYRLGGSESHEISLIVWELDGPFELEALCDSELDQMRARGAVEPLLLESGEPRQTRRASGIDALGMRYQLDGDHDSAPDGPALLDATYFQNDGLLLRLSVLLPAGDAEDADAAVAAGLDAIQLRPRDGGVPAERFEIAAPVPGNVVTVVHESGPDAVYAYLEALPRAARTNDGLPVVVVVESTLSPTARTFLQKYRPEAILLVGDAHGELPETTQAPSASELWGAGGTVVASERSLASAAQAAALAVRLDAALVVDGPQLSERLAALQPTRVYTVGEVAVEAPNASVEPLPTPRDVARAAGGADYIALCNAGQGPGAETAALAATLAGVRGGVVLPLEVDATPHRIPLSKTRECPPGLDDVQGTGDYLVGRFQAGNDEILAGAAQTTVVRVATSDSPRYGRLRIDLDGDGELAPDEEPRVGSTINLAGESYHLTYHYGHNFVGYLADEILLSRFHPDQARDEIRSLVNGVDGVSHIAIVGTPDRIPFCYSEATGYFEAFDIKQELPSDAPYANLDDDSYLELAVGRLPAQDLFAGSAMIANTVAYHRLPGDWHNEATFIQPGFHELEGALPWVLPNAEALIRGIEGDLVASGITPHSFYRDDVEMDAVVDAMSTSGWIAYFNHSGPGTWGIHPGASIVTGRARGRANRSLPPLDGAPIVFGGGCSSAALDVGQRLERTFPGRFFELGATAYLGNTRVAYARSEHLVQLFFARLASGESTLGEAYRDGRNFLAHLLENHHLMGELELGIELGERDFLWAQHRILNLFGDPALRPRGVNGVTPGVEVTLKEDETGASRLTVERSGDDRRDPILMMPASGQGSPREFFARTGAGMTSSHLPYHYARGELAPVRSYPEIQPGAWVDLELPSGARDVTVVQTEGPTWADRGFSVRAGARGEPRLLMYVPLVRSSLEHGGGSVADAVEFSVRYERSDDGDVRAVDEPRIHVEQPWRPARTGTARVDDAAEETLERVRRRYPARDELTSLRWRVVNPQPRLYGEGARLDGRWSSDGKAAVEASHLASGLDAREDFVEEVLEALVELPFANPLPPLDGLHVTADGPDVLVLTPLEEEEGAPMRTEIHVDEDGNITRHVDYLCGVADERRFEWREGKSGPILERMTRRDPVRPEDAIVYEIDYEEAPSGNLLPERIILRLDGILPQAIHFEFEYFSEL